ncbi:MAG: hypothetical protein L3J54_04445, partial [Draconibacterium sp.]|nr:hypothetical protein [Draconibacterium sp.]
MRNFFTKLFLLVFMMTAFGASGFAQVGPNDPEADLWPEHGSTTQLQPTVEVGVQTLTLTFPGTDDSNTVWRLMDEGIISLNADPGFGETIATPFDDGGSGTFQQETIQIGGPEGWRIVQNGNTIEVTFEHAFIEDFYYYVTVSADAIQMMDQTFYPGLGYNPFGGGGSAVETKSATIYGGPMWDYLLFYAADWAFRVDDVTDPLMTDCDFGTEIENGDRGVSTASDEVYICFDEPLSWVGGTNPLGDLGKGDIAFYLASNEDLRLPAGEFGGDVVYQIPLGLDLSSDGMTLTITLGSGLKSAARGDSIWPADADIYLRFISGLLEDKGGNLWAGLTSSPAEDYTPGVDTYWFTTRDATEISVDIINIDGGTNSAPGHDPIWMNEEFQITLGADDLRWIVGNDLLDSGNAADLLELELDGVPYSFIVRSFVATGGFTTIKIEPSPDFLPANSGQDVTVKVLGGLVRDADLQEVPAAEATFTLGDFMPPVLDASVNNILCTNFDLRSYADKEATVYYALIDVDSMGPDWDAPSIEDIYRGYNKVYNGASWYNVYFNHVADPVGGPYYHGVDPNGAVWQADSFNVAPPLVAFDHIDDFVDPNHGKEFMVYYFGVDTSASGPYTTTGIPVDGQATDVYIETVNLTDCLPPEHEWHFEGVSTSQDPLYDLWEDSENIKKQGRWNFKVATGGHVDELHFIDPSLSWDAADMDDLIASGVFTLEVSDEDCGSSSAPWREVEIESIVYSNDEVIVTPLNSYPSGGCVKITLRSGTFMDASANPINEELSCTKTAETYCDPQITVFTVETKDLLFPTAPEFDGLNGIVALKDGKITVEFNNPMFTPKRDNTPAYSPVLEPISEVATDVNWIGNYIKVRVGDENGAEVTDDVVDELLFSYELTRDAEGGITKVVMTPIDGQLEYESETWYYVEVEELLQDENQRELAWDDGGAIWHNNQFVDPHEQYDPYPTTEDWCESYPTDASGNSENYFMRFRTEDKIAPELLYAFTLMSDTDPGIPIDPLYFELVDSASVSCTSTNGVIFPGIGIPIGALITEWTQMGFDTLNDGSYYIEEDPNTMRPYFTLRDGAGESVDFDLVVLEIFTPENPLGPIPGVLPDGVTDAVFFGFRPFTPLAEGENFSMSFNPNYQASNPVDPAVGLPEGPVFVDDNGNPLVHNTYVEFSTCITDPNSCYASTVTVVEGTNDDEFTPDFTVTFDKADAAAISGSGSFFEITDGVDTWTATDESLFFAQGGGQYLVPWEAFDDNTISLNDETTYTFTVVDGSFFTTSNASVVNCLEEMEFTTVDTTAPAIDSLSPDIDWVIVGDDVDNNLGDDAQVINPRVPGQVRMWFDEDVTMVSGKLIKIYHNGTSLRQTFIAGDSDNGMTGNMWWGDIDEDILAYDGHFHVDVQEGFVIDASGNPSDNYTGWEDRISVSLGDGTSTWTFATGSDEELEYVDFTPGENNVGEVIDPNLPNDAYENLGDGTVRITELSFELSEKSVINDGTIGVIIEDVI